MEAFIDYSRIQDRTRLQSRFLILSPLLHLGSWNPLPMKGLHVTDHDETPPFTEIFGELHFRESSHSSYEKTSAENSSLQLCTEGLGSESYYDLEIGKANCNGNGEDDETEVKGKDNGSIDGEWVRWRKERRDYPPAMRSMSFKTYREEGRLVLEEIRIQRREFLRASREDGRLRLKMVQPEDDDEDEYEDEDEEEKKDKPGLIGNMQNNFEIMWNLIR